MTGRPCTPNDENNGSVPQHRTANAESGQSQRAAGAPDGRSFLSRFGAGGDFVHKGREIGIRVFGATANAESGQCQSALGGPHGRAVYSRFDAGNNAERMRRIIKS